MPLTCTDEIFGTRKVQLTARNRVFERDTAGMPPQYRILKPKHQQLSILRQVTAEQQDGQADHPASEHVDDLDQYPAS
jgi:hypothetical protein